jgi:hypothetical protein
MANKLPTATFWATHTPSHSRALIEFKLENNKVKMTAVFFANGNVLDINVVRNLYKEANRLLMLR